MFSIGQIFEGVIGGTLRSAKVIAIVDGGRIGWLEFRDTKGPPFELDMAKRSAWKLIQHER
jgi:hypothetical protein